MTIKEIYDWAKSIDREDCEIIVEYYDGDYIVSHDVTSEDVYSDRRLIVIDLT